MMMMMDLLPPTQTTTEKGISFFPFPKETCHPSVLRLQDGTPIGLGARAKGSFPTKRNETLSPFGVSCISRTQRKIAIYNRRVTRGPRPKMTV